MGAAQLPLKFTSVIVDQREGRRMRRPYKACPSFFDGRFFMNA
jgi:hypothetical protein